MDLKKTEESLEELMRLYESIRQSSVWSEVLGGSSGELCLPKFVPQTAPLPPSGASDDAIPSSSASSSSDTAATMELDVVPAPDMATAVDALTRIQTTLATELPPKMDRFRKRLAEKDPVTDKPRYGEKTQSRVQALLQAYDFLMSTIPPQQDTATTSAGGEAASQSLLLQLQQRHAHVLSSEEQAKQDAERERQQQEEKARQEALLEEQRKRQEALEAAERKRQEQEAAEAELRRQAEAARQRRLAQERAEQEWINSIPRGPQGVKLQLDILKDATKDDPEALATAITALYTIFQQINAHPEETNFRRIRRTHEKFTQDIGRHKGGVEVLLAAGFELGAIDDVPCYLSKEPNIETDMDGWSAWFDLLKATLEILEQEVANLPKGKRTK